MQCVNLKAHSIVIPVLKTYDPVYGSYDWTVSRVSFNELIGKQPEFISQLIKN